ncbi:hypothetical protein F2P81_005418 [Scophthalmus maximus]|uniref:Uncharacterized protein n=1 Tax=Scophthalmus maximus TaxID=52904 RepID=A0A6A4T321_SCOMX|nr:hypothetical protein F2P81_005418 [Scophthalmus maximus]
MFYTDCFSVAKAPTSYVQNKLSFETVCNSTMPLDSMRSKLEQSVDAFVRARKELEEILPAEGSSEQGRFLTGSSADLRTELKRHKELTASTEASSTKGNKDPNNHSGGPAKMGDSYKFLKSIMG